ncbi:PAS domain S-box protein, partial [Desulfocurvibacter africanus]|uniref:PAS domain S-box protein n=1 Tax=Desulfocurvibacter africanus TaxID=873 RepID=UPI002FDA22B0
MTKLSSQAARNGELRRKAERKMVSHSPDIEAMSGEDVKVLGHELQVHRIELELQNEELREALDKLEEAKARYANLYDFAPVGYLSLDRKGRILQANFAAATLLGLEKDHLAASTLYDHLDAESQDRLYILLRKALRSGGREIMEAVLPHPGGERSAELTIVSAVEGAGTVEEGRKVFRCALSDVTERVRAERELARQKQAYARLAENSPDMICRYDLEGRFLYASPSTTRLLGRQAEEILGRTHAQLGLHPDIRETWERAFLHIRSRRQPMELEFRIPGADGPTFYSAIVVPEFSEFGQLDSILSIARDVSRHKRLEEELRQAGDRAEKASRAKSEFLASMSHEIRTPMNGVIGLTELALMQEPKAKIRDYLHMVKQSANSLLDIINDILDLSKIEAGRVELEHADFDLRDMLGSLFETMRLGAEHKALSFTTAIDPGVPDWINGDEGRLRQIFVNLIGNAIKYTEAGQVSVRVGLENDRKPQDAGGHDTPEPVCLLASVRDTGIGIPKDKLGSIFEPFDTGARSAKHDGTGLGLAITKRLVELMGGRITVQSELGRGSTFTFTAALEPANEAAASEGSGHA